MALHKTMRKIVLPLALSQANMQRCLQPCRTFMSGIHSAILKDYSQCQTSKMKNGLIFKPSKDQLLNTRHVLDLLEPLTPKFTPFCRRATSKMASQLMDDFHPTSSLISSGYHGYFKSHSFRRMNTVLNKIFHRKLTSIHHIPACGDIVRRHKHTGVDSDSSFHIPVFGDIVRRHKHTGVDSDSEDLPRHKELPIVFKNKTKKGTSRGAADLGEMKRRIKKKPAGAVAIKVISCIHNSYNCEFITINQGRRQRKLLEGVKISWSPGGSAWIQGQCAN